MPSTTESPTRESAANEGMLDDLTTSDGVMPLLTEVLTIIGTTTAGQVRVERLTQALRTSLLHARGAGFARGIHHVQAEARRALGL